MSRLAKGRAIEAAGPERWRRPGDTRLRFLMDFMMGFMDFKPPLGAAAMAALEQRMRRPDAFRQH